jgi:hypothetical protein
VKHSETLDKLAPALAKAQAALKPAIKDTVNPFFKSKYADLAGVWDACREALGANGLSVVQGMGTDGGDHGHLWTMLLHESGQYVQGECKLFLGAKVDSQGMGSAITYTRRYALAAILGVVQEDDDGNAAAAPAPVVKQQSQPKGPSAEELDWAAAFDECNTLEELAACWAKVPQALQTRVVGLKDNRKAKLTKGAA